MAQTAGADLAASSNSGGRLSGIRGLVALNKALLGKWSRRFVVERDFLWKQVIIDKFGVEEGGWCLREVRGGYGVGVWKAIRKVDSTNNFPLECVIRRVFRSSQGRECMLLCPVDTPVQILKSTNFDGWSAVSDEEVEVILPAAAYALAKIHMHLDP
ncbi:hypothetical protein CK203_002060 [Vitis vinifera]|uniref:Uncharacterized protein n=1 Tax=Vitis vinifera TaxID=29760 RepID=A0A438KJW5_VITVI|nr:hypothetical protein CK203_002060 [Vitis vinifera]